MGPWNGVSMSSQKKSSDLALLIVRVTHTDHGFVDVGYDISRLFQSNLCIPKVYIVHLDTVGGGGGNQSTAGQVYPTHCCFKQHLANLYTRSLTPTICRYKPTET